MDIMAKILNESLKSNSYITNARTGKTSLREAFQGNFVILYEVPETGELESLPFFAERSDAEEFVKNNKSPVGTDLVIYDVDDVSNPREVQLAINRVLNEKAKSVNGKSGKNLNKYLNEKQSVNPGFLMIGQPIIVTITDLAGKKFDKEMVIGGLTAGGGVTVKDELGYIADLQWDGGQFNGEDNDKLRYFTVNSETGLTYELFIDRDGDQE